MKKFGTDRHWALALMLASMVLAFWINEVNLQYMRFDGIPLRNDQTVITADDESYLLPAQRLAETGSLYANEVEKYSSTIRYPGYAFLCAAFYAVMGAEYALVGLKIFQVLLFGFSVFCLYFIALKILKKRSWALGLTLLYGCLPFSMGFLYYTLTEGVTPALMIFFVFMILQGGSAINESVRLRWFVGAALLFTAILLIRPVLGLIGLIWPFVLIKYYFRKGQLISAALYSLLLVFLCSSAVAGWELRNKAVLGHVAGPCHIYQNEIPGQFRKPHQAFGRLFLNWESDGARFHRVMTPLWEAAIRGDVDEKYVDVAISKLPAHVRDFFGFEKWRSVFIAYQETVLATKPFYDANKLMPSELPAGEEKLALRLENMTTDYRKEFSLNAYLYTPVRVYQNISLHSNLSLYMFQHPLRGRLWMEVLRWVCLLLHALTFFLFAFQIFFKQSGSERLLLWGTLMLSLLLLCFWQRGVEERYTLPLLPLALLAATFVLQQLIVPKKLTLTGASENDATAPAPQSDEE